MDLNSNGKEGKMGGMHIQFFSKKWISCLNKIYQENNWQENVSRYWECFLYKIFTIPSDGTVLFRQNMSLFLKRGGTRLLDTKPYVKGLKVTSAPEDEKWMFSEQYFLGEAGEILMTNIPLNCFRWRSWYHLQGNSESPNHSLALF